MVKKKKETQPNMNSCWKGNILVSGEQILKIQYQAIKHMQL